MIKKKPLIAIIGSSDALFKKSHRNFLELTRQQLSARGADSIEFDLHIPLQDDSALFWRDLVRDQLQILHQMHNFDAFIFVPWSNSSMAGFALAKARLGVAGLMTPHYHVWRQLHKDLCYESFSFAPLSEVLSYVRFGSWDKFLSDSVSTDWSQNTSSLVAWSADKVIELADKKSWRAKDVEPVFHNVLLCDAIFGGSAQTILQMQSLFSAHQKAFDFKCYNQFIAQLKDINRVDFLQGLSSALYVLKKFLKPQTVLGSDSLIKVAKVSRSAQNTQNFSCLTRLSGNVCDQGAWVKIDSLNQHLLSGSGPAEIFNSEKECIDSLIHATINKMGQNPRVLFVRNCGPKSGQGMAQLFALEQTLKQQIKVPMVVITDGKMNSVPGMVCITQVQPEGSVSSVLGALKNGDEISWNLAQGKVQVRLTAAELAARLAILPRN